MSEQSAFKSNWEDYKKRRLIFRVIFLSYIPAELLIGVPLSRAHHSIPFVLFIIWGAGFVFSRTYMSVWKCPRCKRKFFMKGLYYNGFARKCLHCKLPKWTLSDPVQTRTPGGVGGGRRKASPYPDPGGKRSARPW